MQNGYSPGYGATPDYDYRGALDSFLRATADPLPQIERILEANPEFVRAHVLRAGVAVAAKTARALKDLRRALEAASRINDAVSAHERAHLEAARAWLQGCPLLAAERYSQIVRHSPVDLLALRLAQSCWFFLGRGSAMRDVAAHALPFWEPRMPDYDSMLSLAAFGHAEAGDSGRAEALALQALDIEPRSPVAIHAFAHALHAQERHAEGARWMRERKPDWWIGDRLKLHNQWHLAMFEVMAGAPHCAAEAFEDSILPSVIAGASDPVDATSLLWHLQRMGAEDASRWPLLAQLWDRSLSPGFWPFLDVLAAVAYANAGDTARLHQHAHRLATIAHGDSCAARLAQVATVPIMRALTSAPDTLDSTQRWPRAALESLGASQPQRKLLERMLSTTGHLRPRVQTSRSVAA